MYGDNIIKEYKQFEAFDRSRYKHFEEYIGQYLAAEMLQAMQEMISIYNSPILKWECFKEHLSRYRKTVISTVMGNTETAIYAAAENGERVNILSELEKALEAHRSKLIRNSID